MSVRITIRSTFALVAAAVGMSTAPLAAQEEVRTITYAEAIEIALEQNSTLRLAENSAELNAVAVRQERMQFFPDFSLSTQGAQSYGRFFDQGEGRVLNETTQSLRTGVSSSVVLFDGFSNVATLRAARLARDAGEQTVTRTRQTVVFTVIGNFLSLIELQEQLRVRQENLAALEALESQISVYVEAGVRPISDLYQQQANVASARLALVEANRAVELAKVDLIQTLQLDPFGEYRFEAPALGDSTAAVPEYNLQELLERAFAQRADLIAGQGQVASAEQGVRAANASRWPQLSLSVGYNTGYTSATDFSFWDQLDQRRGGTVGLGVSLPLFDRFSTRIATERARIQAENARIGLDELRQEVGLQVRRAYLDHQAAEQALRAAEAQLRAAELALEMTRERYEVGAATLVELTQLRADAFEAASALVSARYNLLFGAKLIKYYLGDLDPDEVTVW